MKLPFFLCKPKVSYIYNKHMQMYFIILEWVTKDWTFVPRNIRIEVLLMDNRYTGNNIYSLRKLSTVYDIKQCPLKGTALILTQLIILSYWWIGFNKITIDDFLVGYCFHRKTRYIKSFQQPKVYVEFFSVLCQNETSNKTYSYEQHDYNNQCHKYLSHYSPPPLY